MRRWTSRACMNNASSPTLMYLNAGMQMKNGDVGQRWHVNFSSGQEQERRMKVRRCAAPADAMGDGHTR
jgi:hypothetical protein